MYGFHMAIHARPNHICDGSILALDGQDFQTLAIAPGDLDLSLPVSFEQAALTLGRLPRMFVEGDGSLLWVSPHGPGTWQVEGNLYDRAEKLLYVELKGSCPPEAFDELLCAVGWPATPLIFQLTQLAVFLGEDEFRKFAQTNTVE